MKARACVHSDPPCRSCINRRNRKRGLDKQRQAAKSLGIERRFHGQLGNEEDWSESPHLPGVRWEVKSGKMPALIRNAIAQIDAANMAVGRGHYVPGVILAMADTSRRYAFVELEPLLDLCKALAEVGNGSKIKSLTRDVRRLLDEIERTA